MKVLLINPHVNTRDKDKGVEVVFPLGLGYLAAVLERAGYKVEILDVIAEGAECCEPIDGGKYYRFGLSNSELRKRIIKSSPDVVGISCIFTKRFNNALKAAEIVKDIDRNIITVIGGAHPSAAPEGGLKNSGVDFVILGEGEESFLNLVRELDENSKDFSKIDGIGYRKRNSEIVINRKQKYIEDLDALPFPARELVAMDKYLASKRNSIITSRGCPHRCTFCSIHSIWGWKWRGRRPERVVDEIEYFVKKYGVSFIAFEDDNIALSKNRMFKICQNIIERGLKIYWNTPNGIGADTLTKELLSLMRKSGCYALNLAIESGDEFMLREVICKKVSLEQIRRVVKWCNELGILTLGYFVIGMPGETKETMQRSLDFAIDLPLDVVNVFIATPYPGSRLYKDCVEQGYLASDNIDDFTAFDAVIETPLLSREEIQRFQTFFISQFNSTRKKTVSVEVLKEAIRRPTLELVSSLNL